MNENEIAAPKACRKVQSDMASLLNTRMEPLLNNLQCAEDRDESRSRYRCFGTFVRKEVRQMALGAGRDANSSHRGHV